MSIAMKPQILINVTKNKPKPGGGPICVYVLTATGYGSLVPSCVTVIVIIIIILIIIIIIASSSILEKQKSGQCHSAVQL